MTEDQRCFGFPHVVDVQEMTLEAWREKRDTELVTEMRLWCCRNVNPKDWLHDPNHRYEFRHLEDAVRFRLTWL